MINEVQMWKKRRISHVALKCIAKERQSQMDLCALTENEQNGNIFYVGNEAFPNCIKGLILYSMESTNINCSI